MASGGWKITARRGYAASVMAAAVLATVSSCFLWFRRRWKGGNWYRAKWLDASNPNHRRWMAGIQAFIFDIDGVVHVANTPVPGAAAALSALRAAQKTVLFMTNNATKSPEEVVTLFRSFGATCHAEDVITSAAAAAEYLGGLNIRGKPVYVVGMPALRTILQERAGVDAFGSSEDDGKTREDMSRDFVPTLKPPPSEVVAVVVGTDFNINFYKMARATNYLRLNPKCLFVLTNPDPRAKLGGDAMLPAAGATVQVIATAAGREPDMVCGKPSLPLAQHILESRGLDPKRTCMIGDRLDTDIEFGLGAGMQTIFVESGTMTAEEAFKASPQQRPHFIAPSIAVLKELLDT